jgi:hypothetical protein
LHRRSGRACAEVQPRGPSDVLVDDLKFDRAMINGMHDGHQMLAEYNRLKRGGIVRSAAGSTAVGEPLRIELRAHDCIA